MLALLLWEPHTQLTVLLPLSHFLSHLLFVLTLFSFLPSFLTIHYQLSHPVSYMHTYSAIWTPPFPQPVLISVCWHVSKGCWMARWGWSCAWWIFPAPYLNIDAFQAYKQPFIHPSVRPTARPPANLYAQWELGLAKGWGCIFTRNIRQLMK